LLIEKYKSSDLGCKEIANKVFLLFIVDPYLASTLMLSTWRQVDIEPLDPIYLLNVQIGV